MRPGSLFPRSCHISIIRGPHGAECGCLLGILSAHSRDTLHTPLLSIRSILLREDCQLWSVTTTTYPLKQLRGLSSPLDNKSRFATQDCKNVRYIFRFVSYAVRVGKCYLLAVVPPFVCHGDDGQSLNKTICKENIENAAAAQPGPAWPAWQSCWGWFRSAFLSKLLRGNWWAHKPGLHSTT